MNVTKLLLALFTLLYLLPLAVSAARYRLDGSDVGWRTADRSSAGLLPPATLHPQALVRVFAARTVRWRGIFATHSWIVLKPAQAAGYTRPSYTRYDYTAWGEPIRLNGFEPDGRWFGRVPEVVFTADGPAAAALIPGIQAAIRDYAWRQEGDYRAWPGPNSNTFVAAVMAAVPDIRTALPPTAIGKDFPYDGRWVEWTASGTGIRLTLGGYAGLTVGWREGVELNILGAVAGFDLRRPAIKLPGLGRIGMAGPDGPATPGPAALKEITS